MSMCNEYKRNNLQLYSGEYFRLSRGRSGFDSPLESHMLRYATGMHTSAHANVCNSKEQPGQLEREGRLLSYSFISAKIGRYK